MSKLPKLTFLIHALVGVLLGLPLFIIPGRFLYWVGWNAMLEFVARQNNDPFITRVLGAALLALAWSSFRGWRTSDKAQATVLVEMEIVFTVLGSVGLLRHLLWPWRLFSWHAASGWIALAILVLFAVAWIVSLVKLKK